MAKLTNSWVGYLQRSAEQIMNSLLNRLGSRVPEMTDHSPSNPYVRNLEQMAGMHESLQYYVDNAARETFVTEARLYKSLIQKARERNYAVIGNLPYTVDIRFTLDVAPASDLTIPSGTVVSNADGSIQYRTLSNATILTGELISDIVTASQSEHVTGVTVADSTGLADYEVAFEEKIVHNSIQAYWNTVSWGRKSTLAYSGLTSTDYVQTVNEDGQAVIYFGNGNPTGLIPIAGQSLTVDYDVTLGKAGYVGLGELNKMVTVIGGLPLGATLSVENIANAAGGSDVETIEDLKRHIPLADKTIERAVTHDDFEDLVSIAPGVQSAVAIYDNKRTIYIYIVPVGGGLASGGLITSTQAFIDARKVLGTKPVIKAAGIVSQTLVIDIVAKSNYSNSDTQAAVRAALLDFMDYDNQQVKGTVNLSDLYQVVEDLPQVDHSNIRVFAFKPYARPYNNTTPPLVWTPVPQTAATSTQRWLIQFTNSTTFRLIRGATLIGTYTTGTTVTTSEIQFVIPAGVFSNGNTYEFYTYPYNANSVTLTEPSIPNSQTSDITLNVTGGY